MIKHLLEIDKDSLPETTQRKLKKIVDFPKFTPDEVILKKNLIDLHFSSLIIFSQIIGDEKRK